MGRGGGVNKPVASGFPDRSRTQEAEDFTDLRLFSFLHKHGLLTGGEDVTYPRDVVLGLVRAAYWHGAADHARDRDRELVGFAEATAQRRPRSASASS